LIVKARELGIEKDNNINEPLITKEDAQNYIKEKKRSGKVIGFGVILCILGPALLILISTLFEDDIIGKSFSKNAGDYLGLFPLFIFVAIAVVLFISTGMRMEKYKYIEDGVQLPYDVKSSLSKTLNEFMPGYNLSVIVGVCLCVLSPLCLFIASLIDEDATTYGLVALFVIVSIAAYILIYFGTIKEAYNRLLKLGDYSPKSIVNEKENRVIGAVASIVWPLAFCIFLFCGIVFNAWHPAWIIFPITGILFGVFTSAYSTLKGKNN
jgi:hypothetical protein